MAESHEWPYLQTGLLNAIQAGVLRLSHDTLSGSALGYPPAANLGSRHAQLAALVAEISAREARINEIWMAYQQCEAMNQAYTESFMPAPGVDGAQKPKRKRGGGRKAPTPTPTPILKTPGVRWYGIPPRQEKEVERIQWQ